MQYYNHNLTTFFKYQASKVPARYLFMLVIQTYYALNIWCIKHCFTVAHGYSITDSYTANTVPSAVVT